MKLSKKIKPLKQDELEKFFRSFGNASASQPSHEVQLTGSGPGRTQKAKSKRVAVTYVTEAAISPEVLAKLKPRKK